MRQGVGVRGELTRLLHLAAQVEHALLCQYLFAAFSMKRRHEEGGVSWRQLEAMRRWEGAIMLVARQEMEHLGIVLNLRTAIGDAPDFPLPAFPFSVAFEGIPMRFALTPFSRETILDFALKEMPECLEPDSEDAALLRRLVPDFAPSRVDAIARLYDQIGVLIAESDPATLFIGPPGAQLDTHDVFPGAIRGLDISQAAAYDVSISRIEGRETALAAVSQIAEEGEGAQKHGGPGSHFGRIMEVLRALVEFEENDPGFAPARDAVADGVDHDVAAEVLAVFEICNTTMLLALSRFFAFPQGDRAEMRALQQTAFFPMMTTIIRPLGEILTQLPASAAAPEGRRAGASFRAIQPITPPPHREATARLLDELYEEAEMRLRGLVERGDASAALGSQGPALWDRLRFVVEQIARARMNLRLGYAEVPHGV